MPRPSLLLPFVALLLGVFALTAAGGYQGLLLPVRAEAEGFATWVVGAMGAAYAAGFAAGCALVPKVLVAVGHVRTFAATAAVASAAALLHGASLEGSGALAAGGITWVALRGVTGFCFAAAGMIVESWLNDRSTNETRGGVFAAYTLVNLAAGVVGQLALGATGSAAALPFMVCAVLLALSLVPTALSAGPTPALPPAARLRPAALFRLSPLAAAACFGVGVANGAFGTLAPVHLRASGLEVDEVAWLISAALAGGALAQLPLGALSDRIDRRYVLIGVAAAASLVALAAGRWAAEGFAHALALYALLGGCLYAVYPLAVAHANDHAEPGAFVDTAAGLLLLFGVGAVIGPIAASLAMEFHGTDALLAFVALPYAALTLYGLRRVSVRAAPPPAERTPFAPTARDVTPAAAALDPRAEPSVPSPADAPDGTHGNTAPA